jgi:hypothetical protein
MAYNSGVQLAGLAGIIGGGIGAYLGYNQAAEVGMEPWQGALILGGIGLVVASAGAFVLKSAMQFVIYVILILGLIYFLRAPIQQLTGIDPVAAVFNTLEGWGVPVGDIPGADDIRNAAPGNAEPAPE